MNKLQEILDTKRQEVAEKKTLRSAVNLQKRNSEIRDFESALRNNGMQVIGELKLRSPSRGLIHQENAIGGITRGYESGGAAAISVLTDQTYFGGRLEYLQQVREVVNLPVMRKDFIVDEYQIRESYHAGADAILLILDALSLKEMEHFYRLAGDLGLHVLVEAFTEESLESLQQLRPNISGVNARDLRSLELDFELMLERRSQLPAGSLAVAESGITSPEHLQRASAAGYDAALIGTAFMSEPDPGATLTEYIQALRRTVG